MVAQTLAPQSFDAAWFGRCTAGKVEGVRGGLPLPYPVEVDPGAVAAGHLRPRVVLQWRMGVHQAGPLSRQPHLGAVATYRHHRWIAVLITQAQDVIRPGAALLIWQEVQ